MYDTNIYLYILVYVIIASDRNCFICFTREQGERVAWGMTHFKPYSSAVLCLAWGSESAPVAGISKFVVMVMVVAARGWRHDLSRHDEWKRAGNEAFGRIGIS